MTEQDEPYDITKDNRLEEFAELARRIANPPNRPVPVAWGMQWKLLGGEWTTGKPGKQPWYKGTGAEDRARRDFGDMAGTHGVVDLRVVFKDAAGEIHPAEEL